MKLYCIAYTSNCQKLHKNKKFMAKSIINGEVSEKELLEKIKFIMTKNLTVKSEFSKVSWNARFRNKKSFQDD